ncbi:hypothetical protein ANN_14100 [Periplaneta americana]|uniref:Uncharacterized protein n=1 Tax=Periplaneta americana TaxID=6978 RepID=A0ABQ8SVD3_PERAM|nr:hypothetical protein ANN_14100 [Periplaneta americana]
MEALKTGGGTSKVITNDPIIERIIELIRPPVEGLKNPYDGDSEPLDIVVVNNGDTIVLTEGSAEISGNFEIHPTQFNGGQYTPNMLKSPKHPALLQSTVTASGSGTADSANVQAINNCSTEAISEVACDDSANVSVTAPSTSSKMSPQAGLHAEERCLASQKDP